MLQFHRGHTAASECAPWNHMESVGTRQVKRGGVCAIGNTQILLTHVTHHDNAVERSLVVRQNRQQSTWLEVVQHQRSANYLVHAWIARQRNHRLKVGHQVYIVSWHDIFIKAIVRLSAAKCNTFVGKRNRFKGTILLPFLQCPEFIIRLCIYMYRVALRHLLTID